MKKVFFCVSITNNKELAFEMPPILHPNGDGGYALFYGKGKKYMKNIDEIIGRTECLLCIVDRCAIEDEYCDGIYHSWFEREKQRKIIFDWMKDNDYVKYMTETEKFLFKKIVGNPLQKRVLQKKYFEREALEPLLWSLGIVKRLNS